MTLLEEKPFSLAGWIAFAVIGALAAVFVVTAMMRQRTLEQRSDEYREKGAVFGALSDQAGCMQEGFLRSRALTAADAAETDLNTVFTAACLRSSLPTADFCRDLPALGLNEWKGAQCKDALQEAAHTGCLKVLEARIDFCALKGER